MKRIYKAINEGLSKSLMNFDDTGLEKTNYILHNIKEFHIGDYVYKDAKLGYNNYVGKKVAVCVNDEPSKELYVVLNHKLLNVSLPFAKRNTGLYKDVLAKFGDGWTTTLYIFNNYKDELEGTIWELLRSDEYIPTKDELLTIYNNYKDASLLDELGFVQLAYWSSSLFPDSLGYGVALYVNFGDGHSYCGNKSYGFHSVALLHIK